MGTGAMLVSYWRSEPIASPPPVEFTLEEVAVLLALLDELQPDRTPDPEVITLAAKMAATLRDRADLVDR